MESYEINLICGDHLEEVERFLSRFFQKKDLENDHQKNVVFLVPNSAYQIKLMRGVNLSLTQGVTLAVVCETRDQLEEFAERTKTEIKELTITGDNPYTHHYVEVPGPQNICKIEVNYREDTPIAS